MLGIYVYSFYAVIKIARHIYHTHGFWYSGISIMTVFRNVHIRLTVLIPNFVFPHTIWVCVRKKTPCAIRCRALIWGFTVCRGLYHKYISPFLPENHSKFGHLGNIHRPVWTSRRVNFNKRQERARKWDPLCNSFSTFSKLPGGR